MNWLSEQFSAGEAQRALCEEGVVSIGGAAPAVVTDGETRNMAVLAPGGYHWQPAASDKVLALRGGRDCVAGVLRDGSGGLAPGEVMISTGGASIVLRRGGRIELTGTVYINGKELTL